MTRRFNTNRIGLAWEKSQVISVWLKGMHVKDLNPSEYRQDKCGKLMKFSEHGNRDSAYGWEIDHIIPVSNGGGDDPGNLQPLNWVNNASKSDSLNWNCG